MLNSDITYCSGKNCLLCSQCRRYQDGQRIINSHEEGQYYWMDNCNEETREAYIEV